MSAKRTGIRKRAGVSTAKKSVKRNTKAVKKVSSESAAEPTPMPALREEAFSVPTKDVFLKEYQLSEADLEKCGLNWDTLQKIAECYMSEVRSLQTTGNYVAERLRALEAVHSVKVRIKNPSHLLEKVVRKRLSEPDREINVTNYRSEITDLIGIRALHLFKAEWHPIHQFITASWPLDEKPTANLREGDQNWVIELFRKEGCEIKIHAAGYRSVHYLIRSQPTKEVVIAELQVRTIFEEGWSEIDHRVRYPYDQSNDVLSALLEVFNRLAGSADEMGSLVEYLKTTLSKRDEQARTEKDRYEETVASLKGQIAKLNITAQEKDDLERRVKDLERKSSRPTSHTMQGLSVLPVLPQAPTLNLLKLDPVTFGRMGISTKAIGEALQGIQLSLVKAKCRNCGSEVEGSSPFAIHLSCAKCSSRVGK